MGMVCGMVIAADNTDNSNREETMSGGRQLREHRETTLQRARGSAKVGIGLSLPFLPKENVYSQIGGGSSPKLWPKGVCILPCHIRPMRESRKYCPYSPAGTLKIVLLPS